MTSLKNGLKDLASLPKRWVIAPLYVWALRFLGAVYIADAWAAVQYSDSLMNSVNWISETFKLAEPTPVSTEHFWNVEASAFMLTLSVLSFLSSLFPQIRAYLWIHVFSKILSGSGLIFAFFNFHHYFVYLLGASLELFIFLFLVGVLFRTRGSPALLQRSPRGSTP